MSVLGEPAANEQNSKISSHFNAASGFAAASVATAILATAQMAATWGHPELVTSLSIFGGILGAATFAGTAVHFLAKGVTEEIRKAAAKPQNPGPV